MTKLAMIKLLAQLGVTLLAGAKAHAEALLDQVCAERGLLIGVEHETGDWVILTPTEEVIARAA